MNDLGFDRVGVRRKGGLFHQDLKARFRRSIKCGHHEVQIHRQAIHADHFGRLCPNQSRDRIAQRFVIGVPGRPSIEMSVDGEIRPII